jgi:4-amino-4-deoxy-L-arabinose transferase-like glycosyltransferase
MQVEPSRRKRPDPVGVQSKEAVFSDWSTFNLRPGPAKPTDNGDPQGKGHHFLIPAILVAALVFFPNLGATRLWDEDEGFYASTAAEMLARREWIVPHFNGEMFGHKPPLMYWMMMAGYSIFGVNEWGARFFSAVAGVLAVLLTFYLGKKLFSARVGFMAALILSTSIMFTIVGRSATPDSFLVLFTVLPLFVLAREITGQIVREKVTGETPSQIISWQTAFFFYGALGLGMLTKGPIAVIFPLAVAVGVLLVLTVGNRCGFQIGLSDIRKKTVCWLSPRIWLDVGTQLRPLTGAATIITIAAPWYLAVGLMTDWDFHREFFGVHHFQRATTSMEGHRGSILYYPASIMIGMYPWTVATLPALLFWLQRLASSLMSEAQPGKNENGVKNSFGGHLPDQTRNSIALQCEGHLERFSVLLVSTWGAIYLVVFSLAATKLPNYILPAYPAFALMFACSLEAWYKNPKSIPRFWHRAVIGVLIFVGATLVVVFSMANLISFDGKSLLDRVEASDELKHGFGWIGLIGLPAMLGGIAILVLIKREKSRAALMVFCSVAFLTVTGLWNGLAPWLTQFQRPQQLMNRFRDESLSIGNQKTAIAVATYDFFRPSLVFYNRAPIRKCYSKEAVAAFFASHPDGILVVDQANFGEVQEQSALKFTVVDQCARFPEQGTLLFLVSQTKPSTATVQ